MFSCCLLLGARAGVFHVVGTFNHCERYTHRTASIRSSPDAEECQRKKKYEMGL